MGAHTHPASLVVVAPALLAALQTPQRVDRLTIVQSDQRCSKHYLLMLLACEKLGLSTGIANVLEYKYKALLHATKIH